MTDTAIPTAPETLRSVDGHRVPAAGTWMVDPAHSNIEFVARHLMVTKVRGRVGSYTASIVIADRPEESSVGVTMDAASIATGDDGRDGHLRSADFFDVERYPTLSFRSTHVAPQGGDRWLVTGDLAIRDIVRPVELAVEFEGVVTDPWGNDKALFTASTEIDREDWGLTWNQPLAGGGALVGRKVRIELEVQASRG